MSRSQYPQCVYGLRCAAKIAPNAGLYSATNRGHLSNMKRIALIRTARVADRQLQGFAELQTEELREPADAEVVQLDVRGHLEERGRRGVRRKRGACAGRGVPERRVRLRTSCGTAWVCASWKTRKSAMGAESAAEDMK